MPDTPNPTEPGTVEHRCPRCRHVESGVEALWAELRAVEADVEQLREMEKRLRESEANLAAAQRITHLGSWELDLTELRDIHRNPLRWSDEVFRIFGYEPGGIEVSNENFFAAVHPDDREAINEAVAEAIATRSNYSIIHRIIRPDGEIRVVREQSSIAYDGETGKPLKMIGTVHDITEFRLAEEELARSKADLEKALELDRFKGNLLSAVSHELRTPLTSIKGYAEFLEDEIGGSLTPQQRAFVSQIQAGADKLQRLVADLLDFAQLEAGIFRLHMEPSSLADLIRKDIASLMPQAHSKGITLEADLPDDPLRIAMDPKRVSQVLLNLLGNALKFTGAGGCVTVTARPEGDRLRVAVRDTGIGIAPEHQERLFEKFYQVDPGITRQFGGAGLGLSICKALIEAHGGAIGLHSCPGAGTEFWFALPTR